MESLVCGGLRIDYLITAAGEARLNQIGGNAIYAAVGARMWSDRVQLLARAGENFPRAWLAELAERGILTDHIVWVAGWQEMRTFYAYLDENTRVDHDPAAHFAGIGRPLPPELEGYVYSLLETHNPNSPLVLRAADVPQVSLDTVHISPLALLTHRELVQTFRRQSDVQITVDPGEYRLTAETEADIRAYCAQIDAFLPSELEIGLLLDSNDPYEAAETFGRWGAPLVVIKRGKHGCLLYERDARRFTTIPAFPTKVVDVTGAGDAFCGAFSVGLRQTGDPLRSALMGTVTASFVIEGYGALYSMKAPRAAMEQRLEALAAQVKVG